MHPPYCALQRKLTPSPTLHHPLASPHMTSSPVHHSYLFSLENTATHSTIPSPLTPHLSSLIPHSSSLTPHPSSLIPHPSPLTPHPSFLIPHPSPLIPHPLPLIPHPSPTPHYSLLSLRSSFLVHFGSSTTPVSRWCSNRTKALMTLPTSSRSTREPATVNHFSSHTQTWTRVTCALFASERRPIPVVVHGGVPASPWSGGPPSCGCSGSVMVGVQKGEMLSVSCSLLLRYIHSVKEAPTKLTLELSCTYLGHHSKLK